MYSLSYYADPSVINAPDISFFTEETSEYHKNRIQELFEEVKTYGGDFSFIWHNSTIGGQGIWNGWEEVLDYTINLKSPNE